MELLNSAVVAVFSLVFVLLALGWLLSAGRAISRACFRSYGRRRLLDWKGLPAVSTPEASRARGPARGSR